MPTTSSGPRASPNRARARLPLRQRLCSNLGSHPPRTTRAQDQGRRGTSYKPQSPFAKLGGAAALKKRRSSGAGKRGGAEEDKGGEERSVGKLSPWLLGLMLFAVAMSPLIQLFNTAGGKSPSRFPGAR